MADGDTIDALAYALEGRKAEEAAARQARIKAEEALISEIGTEDEGTRTIKTRWYKVSTVSKINRKLIAEDGFPEKVYHQIIRVKHELDMSRLKKLATSDPRAYAIALSAIESKPAKTEVKIERIAQEESA